MFSSIESNKRTLK